MEFSIFFLFLSAGLFYLHTNPAFLTNFWLPQGHVENAGRVCLVAGIFCAIMSLIFFTMGTRLTFLPSLLLFAALIFITGILIHLGRGWLSSHSEERERYSRSFVNWLPALIVLLIIIFGFSC